MNWQKKNHLALIPDCGSISLPCRKKSGQPAALLFGADASNPLSFLRILPSSVTVTLTLCWQYIPLRLSRSSPIQSSPRLASGFAGVGGGTTTGPRVVMLAKDAEALGAMAVVVNAPTTNEVIHEISKIVDIPLS